MNGGKGSPLLTLGGGRTVTMGNGGPILKVSSPVIQGPNGSFTLMIPSCSSMTPSPNVSVSANPASITSGKRIGSRLNNNIHTTKERKTDNSKDSSTGKQQQGSKQQQQSKEKEEVTLKTDLRNIMHAFGDECMPSEESVQLVEVILRQEMEAFLFICDTAALLSGSKILGLREYIYAIRNDKARLCRLFKFLAYKDEELTVIRIDGFGTQILNTQAKGHICAVKEIIEELGLPKSLEKYLDCEIITENPRTEIALRADRVNQRLNNGKYVPYARARSVSFGRKLNQLTDWIGAHLHPEHKFAQIFTESLGFLIYEMVSELIDLSCIVKREQSGYLNHIDRLCDTRGSNPDTCMSAPAFQRKRKDDDCNNVSEILVQSSELEAKRLKNVTVPNYEILVPNGVHVLSPSEIREAYSRLRLSSPPSMSYVSRAENLRNLNFQY